MSDGEVWRVGDGGRDVEWAWEGTKGRWTRKAPSQSQRLLLSWRKHVNNLENQLGSFRFASPA